MRPLFIILHFSIFIKSFFDLARITILDPTLKHWVSLVNRDFRFFRREIVLIGAIFASDEI